MIQSHKRKILVRLIIVIAILKNISESSYFV